MVIASMTEASTSQTACGKD